MKRKFISVLIAVLCIFAACFAACGDGGNSQQNGSSDSDNTQQNGSSDGDNTESGEKSYMFVYINDNKLQVTLEKNSSVDALLDILQSGDIVYVADDYGGFEKVGNIGHTLPRNDTQINTVAGDVILYQGNNICLYYGNNSWSFTKIGRIEGYTQAEIRNLLGAGNGEVQVKLSLK